GTGGLRKLRFAPPSWHTGKRGATRVCYAYFSRFANVLLVVAFGKNEQANLDAGQKREAAKLLKWFETWLERHETSVDESEATP
ncbi:MAG: hypothetical protein ACREIT_11435, partial [Tepidisphaeraceae bacterium]